MTDTLRWERYAHSDDLWHLIIPMARGTRRAACGRTMPGLDRNGIQSVDLTPRPCECRGRDGLHTPHVHTDPWPPREDCGRSPVCLGCAVAVLAHLAEAA